MSIAAKFAALLLCIAGLGPASAQDAYPSKPITWVVPNPPGGGADAAVRVIASALGPALGQQLVIENKPGAGTMLGASAVARAKPDGYTILTGDVSTFATNPYLFKKTISYRVPKDFAFVGMTTSYPMLLVVKSSLPVENAMQFVEYAKRHPGKLNFGTAGQGVPHHFALELFMDATGTRFVHVPFKGSVASVLELLGGQVDAMFLDVASGLPFLQDKRLRILGVASKSRFARLPDTPTLAEAGVKFDFNLWQGVAAPAGTPEAIVNKLSAALNKALSSPDVKKRLHDLGAEAQTSSPPEFTAFVTQEGERLGRLIADKHIAID